MRQTRKLPAWLSLLVLIATGCQAGSEDQAPEIATSPTTTEAAPTDLAAPKSPDGKVQEPGSDDTGPRSAAAAEANADFAPWDPDDMEQLREEVGLVGPGPQSDVPDPRFPAYLKPPESSEELLVQARDAIRQTGGRVPLGLAEPGDTVAIVVPYDADPIVQEAIVEAFSERDIEARILWEYELAGVPADDFAAVDEATDIWEAGDGQREAGERFEQHGDWHGDGFEVYLDWVKEQDPLFYGATWPEIEYPSDEVAELADNSRQMVADGLVSYLDDNDDVSRVYYRQGGRTGSRNDLEHHSDKFMGNYTYLNHYDLMSQVPAFPSDVWRMIETQTLEPLPFVDRVEASDPEGTAFGFDLTEEQAERWFDGAYQQGHLYMMPNQATGRLPYSVVDYPAFEGDWVEPVQIEANGVIASTNSHATNHNRVEVHVEDGYLQSVEGGGLYGRGMQLATEYPEINDLTWPFQEKPGFMWLFEAGTGTNPKYFKHPTELLEGANSSERNVGGVIHWSFGAEIKTGPNSEAGELAEETIQFSEENAMPAGHAFHHHNLLPTYQVRLRDSGEWITLIEHGIIEAYNNPEVRALASRYGDPDELLSRDWIPELPGINAPGNYDEDYGSRAGEYWVEWSHSIEDGSNEYMR